MSTSRQYNTLARICYFGTLFGVLLILPTQLDGQESIAEAKARPDGSVITIAGTATNGSSLGQIRYLQDSSAGIALFPGSGSAAGLESQVMAGTKVQVTGVLTTYHGLREINPILSFTVISQGNALPDPIDAAIVQLDETLQGMLVRVTCLDLVDGQQFFFDGENAIYTPDGAEGIMYISGSNPLAGTTAPASSFDLVAIASYYDGLQLLPRGVSDVTERTCFHVTYGPSQDAISAGGFMVTWGTSQTAQSLLRAGISPDEMTWIPGSETGTDHAFTFSGLMAATFYYVQCGGISMSGDTALAAPVLYSTASATPGSIEIYFNAGIDASFSNGSYPAGTTYGELFDNLISILASANSSIDVAMYNSNRDDIIAELESARARGVRVRYIADGGQSNGALNPAPDFPVLYRQGEGIMHHKFVIVDPHDPDNAQVWTGSTNFSTGQLALDPNNSLHIRDQALARTYLFEFNEMWGGELDIPNQSLSRTGSAKDDNTPHIFMVGDIPVECYFSPSDRTNEKIINTLRTADDDVALALLLITRNDIATTLADLMAEDVRVRGIVNDLESSASVFNQLIQSGASMQVHDPSSIFHHKYALIDYASVASNPVVITGSHNWTTSATSRNDENTLIIHDSDIANIYLQEFEARWSELVSTIHELRSVGFKIYPNPFQQELHIESHDQLTHLELLTMTGRSVARRKAHGTEQMQLAGMAPGAYLLRLTTHSGYVFTTIVVKMR